MAGGTSNKTYGQVQTMTTAQPKSFQERLEEIRKKDKEIRDELNKNPMGKSPEEAKALQDQAKQNAADAKQLAADTAKSTDFKDIQVNSEAANRGSANSGTMQEADRQVLEANSRGTTWRAIHDNINPVVAVLDTIKDAKEDVDAAREGEWEDAATGAAITAAGAILKRFGGGWVLKKGKKKVKCTACPGAGKPVNPIQGVKFLADAQEIDFSLPAPLPLVWQRKYVSNNEYASVLGQGWNLDALTIHLQVNPEDNDFFLIDSLGRDIHFGQVKPGQTRWHDDEQITLQRGPANPPEDKAPPPRGSVAHLLAKLDIPIAWTHNTACLDAGDGAYLVFRYIPTGSAEHTANGYQPWHLVAIIDNQGQSIQYGWQKLNGEPYVACMKDSADRLYGLHYTQAVQRTDADKGVRLMGVALLSGPASTFESIKLPATPDDWNKIPSGRWLVRYGYSPTGQLAKVTNSIGETTRTFEYDLHHRMVEHRNQTGLVSRYRYIESGPHRHKVAENASNDGQSLRFDYHEQHTDVIDQLGRVTRYHFDGKAGEQQNWIGTTHPDGSKDAMVYDPHGRLVSVTDALGRTTRFGLDAKGRVAEVVKADGTSTRQRWHEQLNRVVERQSADGHVWTYTFDDTGRQTSQTDPLGHTTYLRYPEFGDRPVEIQDPTGKSKQLEWDIYGNLVRYVDCSQRTTTWGTDSLGFVNEERLPNGARTHFAYDPQARLRQVTVADGSQTTWAYQGDLPIAQHNADGSTLYAHYTVQGTLRAATNALGHSSRYLYDQAGRVHALVNENQAEHRFAYDIRDRLTQETTPDGCTTHYHYDAAGQLIEQTQGSTPDTLIISRLQRDAQGRLVELAHYRPNPDYQEDAPKGSPESLQEICTGRSHYTYNPAGLLLSAGNAAGELRYSYNARGELLKEEFIPADPEEILMMEEVSGKVPAQVPNQSMHQFQSWAIEHDYDLLGNRIATRLPECLAGMATQDSTSTGADLGHQLNYLHYGSGHLHQINLGGRTVADIERDVLHREIQRSQGVRQTQFGYDALGRLTHSHSTLGVTAGNKEVQLPPALAAQVRNITRQYRYDVAGNLVQSADAQRGHTRYGYDLAGFVRSRQSDGGQAALLEQFDDDPAGNILDGAQAPTPAPAQATPSTPKAPIHISVGQWQAQAQQVHQRLSQELNAPAQKSAPPTTGAVKSNRVEVYQDHRYSYDTYGRLCKKISGSANHQKVLELYWNDSHQLSHTRLSHTHQGKTRITEAHYAYDALGRRIAKTSETSESGTTSPTNSTQSTLFVWSGNQLLGERQRCPMDATDATEQVQTATYVYEHPDSFVPIARLDNLHRQAPGVDANPVTAQAANDAHWPQGVNVYHLHTDQIGTPHELTHHHGPVAWQAEYKTWGNTLRCEWVQSADIEPPHAKGIEQAQSQPIAQNLRFQGQYFDEETGLHYNRFRYYDPDVGRFICQDPIGVLGGQNIYSFAPNPTGWIDPLGLSKGCAIFAKKEAEILAQIAQHDYTDAGHTGANPKIPGGVSGAVSHTAITGDLVGGSDHRVKARSILDKLKKIMKTVDNAHDLCASQKEALHAQADPYIARLQAALSLPQAPRK